jgi:hypothetical protein
MQIQRPFLDIFGLATKTDMPKQSDLKRLVRARMKETGENYTAARMRVLESRKKRPVSSQPFQGVSRPTMGSHYFDKE